MHILDNFKSLLFCFHTLGVRRPMSQIQKTSLDPDQGPLSLQRTSYTKSMKTKKKAFKIIKNIHFIEFLKSLFSLRYEVLDPVFGQNRIHITGCNINLSVLCHLHISTKYLNIIWGTLKPNRMIQRLNRKKRHESRY